jgi:type III pantothenate kinase
MLLAIDVGNTHSGFALCKGDVVEAVWRVATDPHRTEDEYAATLLFLMAQKHVKATDVEAVIISSVVPDTIFPLRHLAIKYFGGEPLIVGRDKLAGDMKVLIDRPEELGADRLVNAFEGWSQYRQPLIVIDFGTATTFDVVNVDGAYVGGVIAPGVNLSLEALQKAAAKLHGVRIHRPEKVIGTNTTVAMQSGIYYGYLGLIEGIITRIRQQMELPNMLVIATGGLAGLFGPGSPMITHVDPELTMRGLQRMYARHVNK